MLGRRREQILIIVGLLGLNILLGWSLVRFRKDYRNRTQWLDSVAPAQSPGQTQAPLNPPGQTQSFVEIVDRSVFTPLRGVQPSQPQDEAKAPKLPILFGSMNLGNGRFALMAPGDQPSAVSRRVLPGEEIGGYKLVSIGDRNVVLEWQEKKITLDISESARHAPGAPERTAGAVSRFAPVSTEGTSAPPVKSVAPVSSAGPRPSAPQMSTPAAQPEVAPGTVVGGKQKVLVQTPFGTLVQWHDVGQAGSQTPQQTGNPNK
jgi:hypothetical protein